MVLPSGVSSIFSKYTRSPLASTTATAIVQLFLRTSASAAAATFLAFSRLIEGPYDMSSPDEPRRSRRTRRDIQYFVIFVSFAVDEPLIDGPLIDGPLIDRSTNSIG